MKINKFISGFCFGIITLCSLGDYYYPTVLGIEFNKHLTIHMEDIFLYINNLFRQSKIHIDTYDIDIVIESLKNHEKIREVFSRQHSQSVIIYTNPVSGKEITFCRTLFSSYATFLWILNQKMNYGDAAAQEFLATLRESYFRYRLALAHVSDIPKPRYPLVNTLLPLSPELEAAIACFINLEKQNLELLEFIAQPMEAKIPLSDPSDSVSESSSSDTEESPSSDDEPPSDE